MRISRRSASIVTSTSAFLASKVLGIASLSAFAPDGAPPLRAGKERASHTSLKDARGVGGMQKIHGIGALLSVEIALGDEIVGVVTTL